MTALFKLRAGLEFFLASTSPRREALLASLGIPFTILAPSIQEPLPADNESPPVFAVRNAKAKFRCLFSVCKFKPGNLIITADTVVACEGRILGKPDNAGEALQMLKFLNGKTHVVCTGLCLVNITNSLTKIWCLHVISRVAFAEWPDAVLKSYVQSDEPADKAGAYAIQGKGAFLIEKIDGSWTNVVGLPMESLVYLLIKENFIAPCDK